MNPLRSYQDVGVWQEDPLVGEVQQAIGHIENAIEIIERRKENYKEREELALVSKQARKLGYCDAIIRMLRNRVSTESNE